jgi:hypothetical protein
MSADRPQPPRRGDLIKIIRLLAGQGKLGFTAHALEERMDERGIGMNDVLQVLTRGDIVGDIMTGKRADERKCLVVGRLGWTSREAGVATVVVRKDRLIIVTVEWMDP